MEREPTILIFSKQKTLKKCVKSHLDFQNRKICNSKKIPRRLLAEYEEEQARLERLSEKVDNLPEFNFGDVFLLVATKIYCNVWFVGVGTWLP